MADSDDDILAAAAARSAIPDAAGDGNNVASADASDASDDGEGEDASGSDGGDDDGDGGFRRVRRHKKLAKRDVAQRVNKRPTSGAARKRRRADPTDASRYMDIDAEEDEEDDEGGRASKRTREEENLAAHAAYLKARAEADAAEKRAAGAKTAEEIAAEIEKRNEESRYDDRDELDEEEGVGQGGGVLKQAANLPDVRDPRLWMLHCKEGQESSIIIALCNKYVWKAEQGARLGIMSAVSTSKGIIYVEAYRDAQVREAASGIADLYSWKPDAIKVVAMDQMTSVLRVKSTRTDFTLGQFVRFARGGYKGDLAQVVNRFSNGARVLVKVIPRINMIALGLSKEARKGMRAGRGSTRPPQRFFDAQEVRDASNGTASIDRRMKWGMSVDMWGGNAYADGMLVKQVSWEHLTLAGAPPTLEEMTRFKSRKAGGEEGEGKAASASTTESDVLTQALSAASRGGDAALHPGDAVAVVKGDLIGLTGRVVTVRSETFTLQPSAELKLTQRLEIPIGDVMKTFDVGEHVRVCGGMYAGETGTVLATKVDTRIGAHRDAWTATVILDSGSAHAEVFVRDLTRSTEVVTSSMTSLEGYALYDLVEVGNGSEQPEAGVVVGLSRRDITVLLPTGSTRSVPVSHIRGRVPYRPDGSTAIDTSGAAVGVGEVVRVMQGEFAGTSGTVKHIHKAYLFLHAFGRSANAGMFVVRSRYVTASGTRARAAAAATGAAAGVGPVHSGGPSGPTHAHGGGPVAMHKAVRDELVGRSVRVLRGPDKNRIGRVRSSLGDTLVIEIHATQKHAHVPRDAVVDVTERSGASMRLGGSATPAMGAATPAYLGGTTPGYGGFGGAGGTVLAGARTALYGGQTPMGAGMGAQTPYAGRAGAQTPLAAGGQTPAGAVTPRAPLPVAPPPPAAAAPFVHPADGDVPWYAPRVRAAVQSGVYARRQCVVQVVNAAGRTATVAIDAGPLATVQLLDLMPVPPEAQSACRCIRGGHAGKEGVVVSIDDGEPGAIDCVVRFSGAGDRGNVEVIPIGSLVRMAAV